MEEKNKKQNPQPDKSINKENEPEQPNNYPGSGQHQPDIQEERSNSNRGNKPGRDGMFPEEVPGDDPKEYNDGEPVEEKSPKLPTNL